MDTLHDSSLGPVRFGTIVADVAEAGPSGDRSVPCAEAAVFVLPSPASKHASNPWIECLEASGSLRIHDHRLLGLGQEAFCRALAQSAVTLGGLRRAEFCLISATCQLEFEPGRFDRADLAQRASSAIRAATAARKPRSRGLQPSKPEWTSLSAFAAAEGGAASVWEVRSVGPGRLRLRHRALWRRHRLATRVASLLSTWPGVCRCRVVPADGDLDVEFDLLALSRVDLMTAAEAALRVARGRGRRTARTGPGASASASACDDPAANPARDLFAAAASFALAIAGLILPGIPSIPFLLLAVDCLSRGYPPLRPRLLSLPGIGDRLRASDGTESLWLDPHFVGKTVVLGLLVAALCLVVHPPFPIVLACEFGAFFLSGH
ncbi:MAG: DUF454 family protein [Isosphaeraceae bacterium]